MTFAFAELEQLLWRPEQPCQTPDMQDKQNSQSTLVMKEGMI